MKVSQDLVKPYEPDAKKRLGQHFLKDAGVIDRIARWIAPAPDQIFLEIGAGTGALSVRIAEKAGALLAVEIDHDCIPLLEEALSPFDSAAVIQADILSLDIETLIGTHQGKRLRVAGNLPYNIGAAIIGKMLRGNLPIEAMFFMLQLEVAERILAQPGTREYGVLSVVCRHYANVKMGFKINPACFTPQPKVMSAVIALTPKPDKKDIAWEADFEKLCKACFACRRKTIAKSLSQHPYFGKIAKDLLLKAGIDGGRRAETLGIAEYEKLTEVYRREFVCL